MKITSDLTNLTTAILILTVQMFIEWILVLIILYRQKHFQQETFIILMHLSITT
jgi:hypothetical protein